MNGNFFNFRHAFCGFDGDIFLAFDGNLLFYIFEILLGGFGPFESGGRNAFGLFFEGTAGEVDSFAGVGQMARGARGVKIGVAGGMVGQILGGSMLRAFGTIGQITRKLSRL